MGQYPRHRSYRAYRGSNGTRRRVPKGVKILIALVLIAVVALGGTAVYLQRYMVYSIDGGHMELPGYSDSSYAQNESPLDLSGLVEESAKNNQMSAAQKR